MIGKKINQLATELSPVSTDLTIIGDPTTGVSKKITLAQLGAIFSGAVSFYTNLAGFPATGDINVIYCAKDTQKLYLWSGSAYVEVFPSQALLDTYQLRSEKGNANGYASLDSQGKVPISQLPSSIMEYKGTWNASTNTPTLANGTGDTGDVYICNVAGTVNFGAGNITFAVGDYVIYSGTIWQRSSGAVGTVTSVAASITGNSVTISGSPVTTSGTLAFAFAGTGAQYIKGDGTLATFPNTIDQAKNLITEVYNSTGSTLTKGTVVYINGGQGNLPTVTKALASGDSTSAQTYGIVQNDITNNNNGFVVVAGRLTDIDTQAYTNGTQLYLSSTTAGAYTSTKQYAPAHLVYIGIIVRSHPTQGVIEVKIQNGYELDELHNVAAQTPTNNDGLFWESSTSLWKNKSIATILGYTPQAQLNGTGFVKASGTTITYDNSTYLTTSAAATTYLPLVLSSTANVVDINGQQFNIWGSAGGYTSGRIIVDPVFSAIGYQNAGVFDGLKILTNGNAEFSNSGVTRFFNQVRFDSTLTNGTYTYTLPGATGTLALTSQLTGGTVTSVGLSSATSGVTIGSTPITTSGTITLAIATASGSQNGLLSSTDWTTFNNKQNALTNPVTGTGTTNYLPKFTGASTIGNSVIQEASGSIGINVSPVADLQVGKSSGVTIAMSNSSSVTSGTRGGISWYNSSVSTVADIRAVAVTDNVGTQLEFYTRPVGGSLTQAMTLNASGNLGLGVTPSAWGSNVTAFELPQAVALYSWSASAVPQLYLGANHYWDGSNWRYKITGQLSTLYYQAVGQHQWFNAPSGTAGNAISFTQAMTLNASGNLSIGNTNDSFKLDVTGTGRFTSNLNVNGVGDFNTSSSSIYDFAIRNSGTGNTRLRFGNATSTARLTITLGATGSEFARIGPEGPFPLYLQTNGTDRLTIDGSTGAATFSSSVTAGCFLTNASSGAAGQEGLRINNDNGYIGFFNGANNTRSGYLQGNTTDVTLTTSPSTPLILGTANVEKMRITSGGNVGIGTTSPTQLLHVNGTALFSGTSLSGNTSTGVYIIDQNIYSLNGGNARPLNIQAEIITFYTGTSYSEKMRITSGGALLLNGTTQGDGVLQVFFNDAASSPFNYGARIVAGRTNSSVSIAFSNPNGVVGSIQTSGTSTSYNTSSDYRLKQDLKEFNGLDLVSKLKAYDYEWKSDKTRSYGVIAHELQSVINYAVTGVKDGKEMQGVDYSKIVPVLIKAIQELNDKIK